MVSTKTGNSLLREVQAAGGTIPEGQVIGINAISGGGGVGTDGGVTASAFDAFLLDRLLQRWKPDHFVEEPAKVVISRVNR